VSEEITLQSLIDKVKTDLFSQYAGMERESKSAYPIFFVDQVELEIAVNISYDVQGGIKVSIPQVADASVGAGHEASTAHKMKVKLSPILTHEEMRAMLEGPAMEGVRAASQMALRRGSALAGEED